MEKIEKDIKSEFVERPWGSYETIDGGDYTGYKVKKIIVLPHQRLSFQSHNSRCEHWIIVSGIGKLQLGENFFPVEENTHIYIAKYEKHRIENTGEEPLIFIETQIGNYLGEDDIIRYEDDYKRV